MKKVLITLVKLIVLVVLLGIFGIVGIVEKVYENSILIYCEQMDGYYKVGAGSAPENYGFNAIRLKAPAEETVMSVELVGLAGTDGYRKPISGSVWKVDAAGWKFGFVAVDANNNRIYGDAGSVVGADGTGSVSFTCPAGCKYVWLVVMGAPTEYWQCWSSGYCCRV